MALVVVLGLGIRAQADMVDHMLPYGPTAVPFPSGPVGTLPLFDPGLGTLTKVTLVLDADTDSGTMAWDNEDAVLTDITLGIGAEVTASALASLTSVAVPLQTDSAVDIDADNDAAADFIGTDSFSVAGGSGSDSDMDMSTAPATLALFTGPGTFPVMLGADLSTFLSLTGGFGPTDPVPGVTDGMVTVIYEFDPIPEPSVLAIISVLVGVAAAKRTRRSRC